MIQQGSGDIRVGDGLVGLVVPDHVDSQFLRVAVGNTEAGRAYGYVIHIYADRRALEEVGAIGIHRQLPPGRVRRARRGARTVGGTAGYVVVCRYGSADGHVYKRCIEIRVGVERGQHAVFVVFALIAIVVVR